MSAGQRRADVREDLLVTAHRHPLLALIADSDVNHRNLLVALAHADPAGIASSEKPL